MSPNRDWFIPDPYRPLNPPRKVRFGDDSFVEAVGIGSILFKRNTDKTRGKSIQLDKVLFVPSFSVSLISVYRLNKAGYYTVFRGELCQVKEENGRKLALEGHHKGGLYHL
ncbi:hypothetical protein B0H10DRAFT_1677780, partial [Mycena sp. CBHHK59/15]